MSASPNSPLATGSGSGGAAPPESGSSPWKLLIALVIAAIAVYLSYSYVTAAAAEGPDPGAAAIRTATVTSGPLERVMRVGGTTSSIVFNNVRVARQRGPEGRRNMDLLELLPSGARVSEGDIVARIDGQSAKDHIDDVNSTVNTSILDVKKRRAEQLVNWNNLEQNLRVAQSNWDKWKLEAQASDVRTVIDQELLELGVEEAEATYLQQRKNLEYQTQAHEAEIKILELTTERHRRHVGRHTYDWEKLTILAPMSGMVVRQQIWRNGEWGMVETGDSVRAGTLFVKIMDTDNMQVEGKINQAESSLFRIGMPARIGLDAFPELEFDGEVYSIGALASSGSQSTYVRDISIRIRINGSHANLLPDLSGYADVVLEREESVTQAPAGAIVEEEGQAYVYVKTPGGFEKRPVQLGMKTFTAVAIKSGLSPGEEVALEIPAA